MTKYDPTRDLPDFARELKTLSPSKLVAEILKRRNEEIKPQAVSMWFTRHPDVEEKLRKELVDGLPTVTQAVDQTVFQNGNFQECPSIRAWILEMNARELSQDTIKQALGNLRLICQGRFPGHNLDFVSRGKWCLKHPDRLTLNDAMEIITLLREQGVDTYPYKRAIKDFLTSKGIVIGKKITVGRSKSFGKYAKLKASEAQIAAIIQEVASERKDAAVCDEFMLKTATRVTATLKAKIEDLKQVEDHGLITVFDKGRKSKYAEGKPWDKKVDRELLLHILGLIGDRKTGPIFSNLTDDILGKLNRKAIIKYCPEILARFPDFAPNHFFRHCFAQIMLDRTNWNYAIVGALGGWTPKALEESYGQPPDEIVKEWAAKYSLEIKVAIGIKEETIPETETEEYKWEHQKSDQSANDDL